MPRTPLLSVNSVHKSYEGQPVLRGLSLKVSEGSLCVLIGRSGCGKSTLLRCIQGLESLDQGSIELRGKSGMVFQSFQLFPHMNALENVMSGPRIVKEQSPEEASGIASRLLAKVGLAAHQKHYPSQLSGGQQQRAAIARALAMRPELMLYDEPTASLDPHLSLEVLEVMLELKREGMTQLLVTHEHAFARRAADQVIFIEEGQVIEAGPARRIFEEAKDARTRRFVKALK